MKWLIFTIIICTASAVSAKGGRCEKALGFLAAVNSNFTRCAMISSVPVGICGKCKTEFDNLVEAYNALITSNDTISNRTCKEIYFDHDRLNIVESIYQDSYNLWEKGFCAECYDSNGNSAAYLSQIRALITIFKACIIENSGEECEKCFDDYKKVNVFYEEIRKELQNKICFDIQDEMNTTRSKWSKDLGCCKRQANLKAFAAVSSVFSLIPLLFYGGFIIYTKRTERNRPMIDAENTINNRVPQATNIQANRENVLPITPQPTSSGLQNDSLRSENTGASKKKEDLETNCSESECSDEETPVKHIENRSSDEEFILNEAEVKNTALRKNKMKTKVGYDDNDVEPAMNDVYQKIASLKSRQFE